MSELRERVRFGRFDKPNRRNGQRRSVLVTVQEGNEIFFGIAKCHSKLDRWDKETGLRLARLRVQVAQQASTKLHESGEGVFTDKAGILGRCDVSNVKDVIGHFREITTYLPRKNNKIGNSVTEENVTEAAV